MQKTADATVVVQGPDDAVLREKYFLDDVSSMINEAFDEGLDGKLVPQEERTTAAAVVISFALEFAIEGKLTLMAKSGQAKEHKAWSCLRQTLKDSLKELVCSRRPSQPMVPSSTAEALIAAVWEAAAPEEDGCEKDLIKMMGHGGEDIFKEFKEHDARASVVVSLSENQQKRPFPGRAIFKQTEEKLWDDFDLADNFELSKVLNKLNDVIESVFPKCCSAFAYGVHMYVKENCELPSCGIVTEIVGDSVAKVNALTATRAELVIELLKYIVGNVALGCPPSLVAMVSNLNADKATFANVFLPRLGLLDCLHALCSYDAEKVHSSVVLKRPFDCVTAAFETNFSTQLST